jgi:putative ABC transport system ATP-binding protein
MEPLKEKPLITINEIGRKYVIGTEVIHALKSVSLTINKGEFVALMGPSGSGKSTLMNILGCLDTPTKGVYVLNGIDVSHMTDNELAEVRNTEIGFVFQTFNLLPRNTALDNVALPLVYAGINKENRQARAKKSLENVGLGNRMDHKPNELSGGQRQRVAVARALINNPSIILADEPTGNLDTKTSIEIMGLVEDIHAKGNTIILVTHEEDIALHAHRIVRMRDGLVENDYPNTNIQKVDRNSTTLKELVEVPTKEGQIK